MKLEEAEIADNLWKKAVGLMFRKKIKKPLVLVATRESRALAAVHTFFMHFPIDLIFLDSEKKVVDMKRNVKPWKFNLVPEKPAKYVIEAEHNSIKCSTGEEIKIPKL